MCAMILFKSIFSEIFFLTFSSSKLHYCTTRICIGLPDLDEYISKQLVIQQKLNSGYHGPPTTIMETLERS